MATDGRRSTKFAVDAMLGSLARKLRAFGFDSMYYKDLTDTRILSLCKQNGRVLVTADHGLAAQANARGLRAMLVSGSTDGRRLTALVRVARESGLALRKGEPRCSLCNGELRAITAEAARRAVPVSVVGRHRVFHQCSSCGQVYWKGGHWKKLRRLEKLLDAKSKD
jgi:uncharacterized protein with PIN domain